MLLPLLKTPLIRQLNILINMVKNKKGVISHSPPITSIFR
jgi:hypothetical protein